MMKIPANSGIPVRLEHEYLQAGRAQTDRGQNTHEMNTVSIWRAHLGTPGPRWVDNPAIRVIFMGPGAHLSKAGSLESVYPERVLLLSALNLHRMSVVTGRLAVWARDLTRPLKSIRVDNVLAQFGACMRREVGKLCRERMESDSDASSLRVTLATDPRRVLKPSDKVDPSELLLDGERIPFAGVQLHIVLSGCTLISSVICLRHTCFVCDSQTNHLG